MSTATATWGIAVGALAVLVCLTSLGVMAWRKRNAPEDRSAEEIEVEDLGPHQRFALSSPQVSPVAGRAIPSVVIHSPSVSPEAASEH